MPAPPGAVLTATRAGTGARHLLFYLNHPGGVVRAWDGVGTLSYGGNDYVGVGGLARVEGVSDSRDLQNHEVMVTLAGVPYSALKADTGAVRGVAATIAALLLDTDGAVVGSARTVFSGKAGNMRTRHDGATVTITVRLRGAFADWLAAPKRLYVPTHQDRLYTGDTGFNFVPALENATIAGWSLNIESTGSNIKWFSSGFNWRIIKDSVTGELLGNNTYGIPAGDISGSPPGNYVPRNGGGTPYVEETSLSNAQITTVGGVDLMTVGGSLCYIDIFGDVRSPSGKLIYPQSLTPHTYRIRKQTTITSNGTATSTTLTKDATGAFLMRKTGGSVTGPDMTSLCYENDSGINYTVNGLLQICLGVSPSTVIVEDVSGTIVQYTAAKMQVSLSDCHVSDTGVILSPSNRRLYRSGGNVNTQFMRVWV